MPSHKNQHFVPRCHLKPFSVGRQGLAINVFNITSVRGIKNAPVKGQCSRNYFYGKDLRIEKILQSTEERYADLVCRLTTPGYILDATDGLMLKRFICLLNGRTEMAARRRALSMEDMKDAIFTTRDHLEETQLTDEDVIRMSLSTTVATWHLVDDLKVCLLRNTTRHPFVTSDDPAIVTNRLHLHRLKCGAFGLMSSGAIMMLPLTPTICAFAYDGDVYTLENVGGWVTLTKDNDVQSINEHQFLKCDKNIYFSTWEILELLKQEFACTSGRRLSQPWEIITADIEDEGDGWEQYKIVPRATHTNARKSFLNLRAMYPQPGRWLSLLRYRGGSHGFTNGSMEGFVRKSYVDAQLTDAADYTRHKF